MESSPLHKAIFGDVLMWLIILFSMVSKRSLNTKISLGRTPLCMAVESSNKELAKILLDRVQQIKDSTAKKLRRTKLHLAAIHNELYVVEYYLKYKDLEYINRKDRYGKTALKYGLEHSSRELIDRLMNYVPKQMQERNFEYPMVRDQVHLAAIYNFPGVAGYFLRFNSGFEKGVFKKRLKRIQSDTYCSE